MSGNNAGKYGLYNVHNNTFYRLDSKEELKKVIAAFDELAEKGKI